MMNVNVLNFFIYIQEFRDVIGTNVKGKNRCVISRCSNSELGQTLWKNSGLTKVIAHMSDEYGNINYEKIMNSFENPALRRRWINSLTSFVAEWFSHITDPANQQHYLSTAQFVGNSFLKSQGFPKSMMFDAQRPTESITR